MKRVLPYVAAAVLVFLSGCAPGSDAQKAESGSDKAARKAGATAYEIAQKSKAAAKKAEIELRKTGKQLKAGWDDAKHQSKSKPDKTE